MEKSQVLESGIIKGNFINRIGIPIILVMSSVVPFIQGEFWGAIILIPAALLLALYFLPVTRHDLYIGFKHGYYLDAAEEFTPELAKWNNPPSYKYEKERDKFTYNFIDRLPMIPVTMAVLLGKRFSLFVGEKQDEESGGRFEYHLNFAKNSWNVTKTFIQTKAETVINN